MLSFIVDYHNKMSGVVDAEAVNDEFAGAAVPRLQSNKINIIWSAALKKDSSNLY